jgi:hypothetical protein
MVKCQKNSVQSRNKVRILTLLLLIGEQKEHSKIVHVCIYVCVCVCICELELKKRPKKWSSLAIDIKFKRIMNELWTGKLKKIK